MNDIYVIQAKKIQELRREVLKQSKAIEKDHEEILSLRVALAEREAEILKLRDWAKDSAHRVSCMRLDIYDERDHGCTCGQEALATPPSTSYLEQWEKDRYLFQGYVYSINNTHVRYSPDEPPEDAYDEGSLVPLYARKD